MKACRPIPPERRQCACGCRAWFVAHFDNEVYINTQHRLSKQTQEKRVSRRAS